MLILMMGDAKKKFESFLSDKKVERLYGEKISSKVGHEGEIESPILFCFLSLFSLQNFCFGMNKIDLQIRTRNL